MDRRGWAVAFALTAGCSNGGNGREPDMPDRVWACSCEEPEYVVTGDRAELRTVTVERELCIHGEPPSDWCTCEQTDEPCNQPGEPLLECDCTAHTAECNPTNPGCADDEFQWPVWECTSDTEGGRLRAEDECAILDSANGCECDCTHTGDRC